MVVCVGGPGSGKTLLLKLLVDKNFNKDNVIVPTVGVNLYTKEFKLKNKKKISVQIRELGGELAPLWTDYLNQETCLVFVIDTQNLGQLGLVGVKLLECISQLEKNSNTFNQVGRLCVVWTKKGSAKTFAKHLKLKELFYRSSVILTEIKFDLDSLSGLSDLESWLISTNSSC